MGPLDDILVVSCEQAVAAPLASRHLADLGARVVKVERPDSGDFARHYDTTVRGESSHFVWLNRSKESRVIDLKKQSGIAELNELVKNADVFVQNLAPGVINRLGLSMTEMRDRHPSMVTCSISGFGTGGDLEAAKAYDALIQAETGFISITGSPDAPAKAGIPVADIAAGMYAFSGILAALFHRERTGEGAHLEINLFDSLVEWLGYPLYYTLYGGSPLPRSGTSHAGIAPYGEYRSNDGQAFMLAIQNDEEWHRFCLSFLLNPSLATDKRFASVSARVAHRQSLDEEISARCAVLRGDEMESLLTHARIAYGRVRDITELAKHPQLTKRERWAKVDSSVGPLDMVLPPIHWEGVTPRMDPIPGLGEVPNSAT